MPPNNCIYHAGFQQIIHKASGYYNHPCFDGLYLRLTNGAILHW